MTYSGERVNPEDSVIDAIDALVDEQLAEGPVDDYSVNRYDKCALCKLDWHGLRDDSTGCPGAYARGYQKREWQAMRRRWRGIPPRAGELYGDLMNGITQMSNPNSLVNRRAREMARAYERELLEHIRPRSEPQLPPEQQLTPEEIAQAFGVAQPQYVRGPSWQDGQLDFIPPHERAQRPSSVPRDSRPCVQCQRPLEWRAAYTFRDSSPLCHDCYDMRVRRARGEPMQQWLGQGLSWAERPQPFTRRCVRCQSDIGPYQSYAATDGTTPLCPSCHDDHERMMRRLEQWGQGWSQRPWAAISQPDRRCTQCQRTLVPYQTYQDGDGVLCQECYDSRQRADRARRDRNDHLMREILAAIPREGVSGDGIRTGQFDISQDAVHRLRTSGT